MPKTSHKAKIAAAAAIAFLGGLIVASGMDLTKLGFAQNKPSVAEVKPLSEASNAFVSIADHVTPAVVSIRVATRSNSNTRGGTQPAIPRGMLPPGFEDFFERQMPQGEQVIQGSGSGFIVSKDGYILTNNHVITNRDQQTVADRVTIQLLDKRTFTARVVGNDPTTDVAVLKIDGNNFPTIPLGDDSKSRVGEWVLAVGNPLGLDFTVTAGIISAKGRGGNEVRLGGDYSITDLIQTDAAINPGNSGGPLINGRGEVIGINNAIASQTGFYSGYGFAIPITLARKVMNDIIAHGKVRAGVLRVQIAEVLPEDAEIAGLKEIRGAKVGGFLPNSPAQAAGLEAGDIIITADGQKVDRVNTLQRIIRNHAPGENVQLEVMRYGQKKSFKVKLAEIPGQPAEVARTNAPPETTPTAAVKTKLGISVVPIPAEMADRNNIPAAQRGVLVSDVTALGPAYQKLFTQDVIFEILHPVRKAIRTPADLQSAIARMKSGELISLNVYSPQGSRVVNMRVGD